MESGLEDRNNDMSAWRYPAISGLNGVRPRRPEQWCEVRRPQPSARGVSMESGLEDRNNRSAPGPWRTSPGLSQWSPA